MKQRSLLLFEESIKSQATRSNYLDHIDRFLKFTKLKDYDSLLKLDSEQLQTILEDYVMHLKKTVSPNSVPVYMTGVKHFFTMNRIKIFWEIINKMFPEKVKRSGQKAWTNEHIQKMLEFNTSKRNRAIIHIMASTGARIGIFNYSLQMRHLKDMGDGYRAILIYADEPEEYWAFLTPEATDALEEYFEERKNDNEKFYPESPIIRVAYRLGIEKAKPIGRNAVISMIFRSINRSGIKRTRVHKHFDIQMDHGFRKRFNIILKLNNSVNSNIAEKIMGHSVSIPLDGTYLPSTDSRVIEKCFEEFKKAIPELTIDDAARKQAVIDVKNMKISELEKANTKLADRDEEIKKQSQRLAYLERHLVGEKVPKLKPLLDGE